jgi:tetratricopeptide (TPR) repeat protein
VESVLSELESRYFVHPYSQDPVEQRLARLEQFVFGKRSSGNPAPRLARLKNVLRPLQATAPTAKSASPQPTGSPSIQPGGAAPNVGSGAAAKTSATGTGNTSIATATRNDANSSIATSAIPAATSSPTQSGSANGEHFSWYHPTGNTISNDVTANPAPVAKPRKEPGLIQVMNRGIDNYNLHRYHNAEDDFEECCAMAPGMSRVYTYLAVTKLQVGERQSALDAFNTCYELDPFGSYGRYAKNCLLVLAGDEAIRKRGVIDSQKDLDKALNKINQQSTDEIARHNRDGSDVSRLRYSMPNTSRNLLGYFRFDTQVQARLAQADAAKRAAETAESANNLKHLLATKHRPGDANLRAWGTNLTTRYYGSETMNLAPYYIPREYPLQLRAIPKSINSVKSTTSKPTHGGAARTKHKAIAKSVKHVSKAKPQHRK